MDRRRRPNVGSTLLMFVGSTLVPAVAFAQIGVSGIAGVVKDPSGAVLPGVTIEAASPALIERVRTAVSDERGEYKIVNLVPGIYSVTFTLAGFNTIRREGIELTASFTATLNADLQVGAVTETVIVSGASPIVDVQNQPNNMIVTTEVLTTLPLAKTTQTVFAMMPSVVRAPSAQDVGGSLGEYSAHGAVHGAKAADEALMLEGMRFNPFLGTTSFGIYLNPAGAEEMVIESAAGGSAEYTLAGLQMNVIPKSGGNRFSGFLFANYAGSGFESDNLTNDLRSQGLSTINKVENVYDANGAVGGPIRPDKLWFFTAHRRWGTSSQYPNFYANLTQGSNIYTPDSAHPTLPVEVNRSNNVRLTWQASEKSKIALYVDNQASCNCPNNETTQVSPEATSPVDRGPIFLVETTWNHVRSSKLLFEAGFTAVQFKYTKGVPPGVGPNDRAITDRGFTFQAPTSLLLSSEPDTYNARASMSYVTGSHHFKAGFYLFEGTSHNVTARNGGGVNYTFLSGVPQSLTEFVSPLETLERQWPTYSIYAQDQWTLRRLTVNVGLRFEALNEYVPAEQQPAVPQFGIPLRNFPEVTCVPCWKDINPRFGVAYDLFGNGKTAVKASLGRYVASEANSISSANDPVNATVSSATRAWTDNNHDLIPQCDLTNPLANNECQQISPLTFGGPKAVNVYDPAVLNGWNKRGDSWMLSARVDQQLRQGLAVTAGYYRTWYGNFLVTDNQLVTPADYSPYCINAPVDARLPGGGGYPICGLYDINPQLFGQTQNLITFASKYGNQYERYNGVDLNVNARFAHGGLVNGGFNIGNQNVSQSNAAGTAIAHSNNCFVVDSPQQAAHGLTSTGADAGACDVKPGYTTQFKLLAAYTTKWDITTSVNFQSLPGPVLSAAYPATTAEIAPSLGRPLAGGTRSVTIQLLAPFSELGPRLYQTDIRLAKMFRVGRAKLQGMFDVYNLFNASTVLQNNINWGPTWNQATVILNGRLAKFGAQLDF